MRVLIAGCGYVGRALGRELAGPGHAVFGLRRSREGEAEMRAAGIEPLAGDITRPETLEALPADFDWVVNTASSTGGGAEDYRAVYLEGNRHLVNWLGRQPPRRFVYTSSTGVYGQNDGSAVDESSPTVPEAGTARILVEAENVLIEAARRRGFPAILLRLAGIYGPGRGYWLKQFLRGEAKMEGKGERWLNLVHRDDVVGAVIAALERGRPGEVYNVVDNEPVSQRTLYEWLSDRLKRPMPPSVPAEPEAGRKRGVTNKRVSNLKLRKELGYEFKHPTFRAGFLAD